MKEGYKRILLFSIVLIVFLSINAFFINILSSYRMIFFLFILLIIFNYLFVLEKNKNRYTKQILFEIFIFIMIFFVLYYALGLITGLSKTPNYYSFKGIKDVILPVTLFIILREVLRYNMLRKADGNKLCTVIVVLLIFMFDIYDDYYYMNFDTQYAVLKFCALMLLPAIAKNVSYSFISKQYGYKPVIVFDLIITLYAYLLPIIPNPSEYVTAIIYILVPVLFAFRILRFYKHRKDDLIRSDYNKKRIKGIILPTLLIMTMVYFYSGYFRYYAIAIASGSMEPNIHIGDVVIVDQKYEFLKLEEGDVIAYRHDNTIIVHRVAKKEEIGDTYYYTKGDANSNMDDVVIEEDVYIGKVSYKVPYVGYPTVWFNKE